MSQLIQENELQKDLNGKRCNYDDAILVFPEAVMQG